MSLKEYRLKIKAYSRAMLEKEHDMHRLAWLIARVAPALKKQGKGSVYAYKTFKSFFDYDALKNKTGTAQNDGFGEIGTAYMKYLRSKKHE